MKSTFLYIFKKGIGLAILFLSTVFLPDIILSITKTRIKDTVLAGIVCTVVLLFLILIEHLLKLQTTSRPSQASNSVAGHNQNEVVTKQTPDFRHKVLQKGHYQQLCLYAISSRYWIDTLSHSNLHIEKCVVLIRKNAFFCDEQKYQEEKVAAKKEWLNLLNSGRIRQLIIYEYDHLPDIFFALFDNTVLVTGLNNFNQLDSTGQDGDRFPQYVFAEDSFENKLQIKKYMVHFNNYVERYEHNKVFDSRELFVTQI